MMLDALPLLVVVALVGVTSISLRRRAGMLRPDAGVFSPAELAELGVAAQRPAFVVVTAPGCSTCGPALKLVSEVAARDAVAVVTIDATRHEELVAAHHVMRAPTTFAVRPGGRITSRVEGVPHADDLAGLLGTRRRAAV